MTKAQLMFLRILMLTAVLFGLVLLAGGFMMWKRPLTVDAFLSRVALNRAGLAEQRLVLADGSRLRYWEGGLGAPLVLLHGAGDQAGAWGRVAPQLAGDFRLIVPDLPGHGGSDPAEGPIQVARIRSAVLALVEARCDEPAILAGNSLGAWMAILVARDRPELVERVVALNGGPLQVVQPAVNLFPTTREEARQTMSQLMGPSSGSVPGFVLDDVARRSRSGPAARLAETAAEMLPFLLTVDQLAEVRTPVDLVWGSADQLMTLDYARQLEGGLPAARLTTLADCGHVPQRECPAATVDALRRVLIEAPLAPPVAETAEADSTGEELEP